MSLALPATAPDLSLADAEPACEFEPRALPTRGRVRCTLPLRHAGTRTLSIAWECVGDAGAPLLLVQGGISATRHVVASAAHAEPGWWQAQAAPAGAFDLARWRVLSIDWLGADGTLDAPIDPADQADAIAAVLDALDLPPLHAFVGASYGAMVGLQFAARHPRRVRRLVAISGAHRAHPQATALRVIQRRIVALGRSETGAAAALALARALAVVGYRTPDEFDARFGAPPEIDDGRARFAVEDYFDAIGPRFVARFTPTAYLRLSESIDLQRVDPARIRVPVDLVAVAGDQVVPETDLDALASALGERARLHRIVSPFGHDAFLKEPVAIAAILAAALQRAEAA